MPDPGERPLSLREWLVLCIACEEPTYGFAIAGLFPRGGSLGRVWQVSKPAIYRAIGRLERLGLVQTAGQQHTKDGPARCLVTATQAGRTAARVWLRTPVPHGRDVRSELMIKLALLDRAGDDPHDLLGSSAPPSDPSPQRWPAGYTTPPEWSTRYSGMRRCSRPCSSWTRRHGRPTWRLHLEQAVIPGHAHSRCHSRTRDHEDAAQRAIRS